MKLFLCDLLGRDTIEGRILKQTVEKELPRKTVVSLYLKVVAFILMIGLNVYFIFGSILYAKDKSFQWQSYWLSTFIFNFAFDIAINGTIEVYILEYLIPLSINSPNAIKIKLDKIVKEVTSSSSSSQDFSVPEFFFVSNIVARRRPDLEESRIVLAYMSTSPAEISAGTTIVVGNDPKATVQSPSGVTSALTVLVRSVLSILALSVSVLLVKLGLQPDFIQILILRTISPAVSAAVTYLLTYLVASNLIYIIVAVIPFYGNTIRLCTS